MSVHIGGNFRADLGNRFRQRNQSRQCVSSAGLVMRSCATPHEPGGGTITSSPGCQSAGVATLCWSAVCSATSIRKISWKLRPVDCG